MKNIFKRKNTICPHCGKKIGKHVKWERNGSLHPTNCDLSAETLKCHGAKCVKYLEGIGISPCNNQSTVCLDWYGEEHLHVCEQHAKQIEGTELDVWGNDE